MAAEHSPIEQDSMAAQTPAPHVVMHDHMISNIIQLGKIVKPQQGDPQKPADSATVLVHIGGTAKGSYTRNWMPWLVTRSGYDSEWWMPEVDEQVVVVAPSGNLALAVVIGTLYRGKWMGFDENTDFSQPPPPCHSIPPDNNRHIHQRTYKDGSVFQYDSDRHQFNCTIKESPDTDAPAFCFDAALNKGSAQLQFSVGKENDTQEKTAITLESGEVSITVPKKITLTVGNSRLEMNGTYTVITVGSGNERTTMTVSDTQVDVT